MSNIDLVKALEHSTAKLADVVAERDKLAADLKQAKTDAAAWEDDSDAMLARAQKAESDLAATRRELSKAMESIKARLGALEYIVLASPSSLPNCSIKKRKGSKQKAKAGPARLCDGNKEKM